MGERTHSRWRVVKRGGFRENTGGVSQAKEGWEKGIPDRGWQGQETQGSGIWGARLVGSREEL